MASSVYPERVCEQCGTPLKRRLNPGGTLEARTNMCKRRFCNNDCANAYRRSINYPAPLCLQCGLQLVRRPSPTPGGSLESVSRMQSRRFCNKACHGLWSRKKIFPSEKRCPACNTVKPATPEYWHRNRTEPDGLATWCKDCANQYWPALPPAYRQALLTRNRKRKAEIRLIVLEHYSQGTMRCDCCHDAHVEFLCLDHVNGGGNAHRKSAKISNLSLWLYKNGLPEGFRVLCHNCNAALAFYGYCPHNPAILTKS